MLSPLKAAGEFFVARIPAFPLDCVVSVETTGGLVGRYVVRDLCADAPINEGYGCRVAFLYVEVQQNASQRN